MLTVGSLFSGIGGLDLGLERAGMRVIWQVENDPFCNKVLAKHWPEVKRYGDIKEIDWSEVERPDIVCGGFPCPVVSQATRGRNNGEWLWPQFSRAIGDLQPDHVIVENVAGLLRGRIAGVVGDLASTGYMCRWTSVPASAFDAPHRRTRVWVVAHAYGNGKPDLSLNAEASELPKFRASLWAWPDPPQDLRVDDGIPNRVDRNRALGNAVVPQVAEWIGRQIVEET